MTGSTSNTIVAAIKSRIAAGEKLSREQVYQIIETMEAAIRRDAIPEATQLLRKRQIERDKKRRWRAKQSTLDHGVEVELKGTKGGHAGGQKVDRPPVSTVDNGRSTHVSTRAPSSYNTGSKVLPFPRISKSSETPPDRVGVPRGRKLGERLPDDWQPSEPLVGWASKTFPVTLQQVVFQTEAFCDHFHAAAGQTSRKLAWDKAWKNWMRRSFGSLTHGATNGSRSKTALEVGQELLAGGGNPLDAILGRK
jgi:hypothetical protein